MKTIEQSERETARWIVLSALYHGAGIPVAERLVLSVLEAVPIKATASDVRTHLHFLESAGMAHVKRLPDGGWVAEITKAGMDVVEYTADCPAGIARPVKYW
ncbi:hypothetical protein [Thiofaba sp. EF100]|uniref:hypothetical protein n=1 Tax=Thiofaba sp. EF100 TaxID=3121274 RepID=UPI003221BDEF